MYQVIRRNNLDINDHQMEFNYQKYFDKPISHGIPLRDRLTDAFAYFPSEQFEVTDFVDQSTDDVEIDDTNRETRKIAQNILNQMRPQSWSPAEAQFIYNELLDSQSLIAINRLNKDITEPWTIMKTNHIDPLESRHRCKLVEIKRRLNREEQKVKNRIERRLQRMYDSERGTNSAICNLRSVHPLTEYSAYLERMMHHKIEIPDRFDVCNSEPYTMGDAYMPMKIMARYYRRDSRNRKTVDVANLIDTMSITLLDLHSVRSKTMFCLHICMPNRREGITVIDQVSYTLNTVVNSSHLSQYLIYYGTTCNYSIYTLFDPIEATLCHLVYALLEPELKRMVFYSPRHILNSIMMLATRTDAIKGLLLRAANISESELLEFANGNNSDDNDDESTQSKSTRSTRSTKSTKSTKSKSKTKSVTESKIEIMERLSKVFDVLYCIREGFLDNHNIISECIMDLWPKLNMIACEIRGQDNLLLTHLKNILSTKLKGITIYSPVFAISEAVIGYNIECHPNNQYIMDPSQAYFEFLEINDDYFRMHKTDLHAKSIRKLKNDHLYELVISNDHTDTLRQITGDIIKICGYSSGVPIVMPICREIELIYSHHQTSDENTSVIESKIITPLDIDQIFQQSHLDVLEYCFRKTNATYRFYLELHSFDYEEADDASTQHTRYKVRNSVTETRAHYRLTRLLVHDPDVKIGERNIENVEVRIVEPETFNKIIKLRTTKSIDPNTIRISRRVVDESEIEILKSAIVHQL